MLKDDKKREIKSVIMKYATNNIFDITKFREENSKIYATIPYYFGSIDKMLEEFGLIKVQKTKNKVTLRNKLAYDYLKELREKYTLEEIATKFPHFGEDMDNLVETTKTLKKELKEYIDLKEGFFERIRNTRKDPNYYRVRHLSFDDEGKVTEI